MHCKSYSHFFSKKFQYICVSLDVNFNESLTNDVVSFEQLGHVICNWVLFLGNFIYIFVVKIYQPGTLENVITSLTNNTDNADKKSKYFDCWRGSDYINHHLLILNKCFSRWHIHLFACNLGFAFHAVEGVSSILEKISVLAKNIKMSIISKIH